MSILTRAAKGSALTWAEADANFLELDKFSEYNNLAAFPVTGTANKYYLAKDTNKFYRWNGLVYVLLSEGLLLGETSSTAYRGDRGKIAYDHSQILLGNPHGTTKAHIGLTNADDTSDLNKPLSIASVNALASKADLVGGKVPQIQLPLFELIPEIINVPANADYIITKASIFLKFPVNINNTIRNITWPSAATYIGQKIIVQCNVDPFNVNFAWRNNSPAPIDESGLEFFYFQAGQPWNDYTTADTKSRLFVFQSNGTNWICINNKYSLIVTP